MSPLHVGLSPGQSIWPHHPPQELGRKANSFSHPAVDYHQKYICHEMPTAISVALKGNGEVSVFGG